ncbi:retrovirus-related pol polyprotein from transposon TNT 1-94 [Tanacetum coccineum]
MIDSYFVAEGFEKCPNEQTLFTKKNDAGNFLIVSIYVDDLIYTGDDETMLKSFKESMMKSFDMTDLGIMRYFLGIEVSQGNGGNFICQRRYATEVLKRFGMFECKAVKTPIAVGMELNKDESGVAVSESYYKQIVGCLMYLTSTRPDLMYGVSLVSRYMNRPTELHLQAIKRILREKYFGYVLRLRNGAVSWVVKSKTFVTITTEAVLVAAAGWFKSSFGDGEFLR